MDPLVLAVVAISALPVAIWLVLRQSDARADRLTDKLLTALGDLQRGNQAALEATFKHISDNRVVGGVPPEQAARKLELEGRMVDLQEKKLSNETEMLRLRQESQRAVLEKKLAGRPKNILDMSA